MEIIINIPAIVMIVFGLLVCFLGYRFFRLSLTLIGGGVGYFIAEYLYENYAHIVNLDGNEVAQFVFVLLFAIGLGSVAYMLYMKAVMLITIIGAGFWISSYYRTYNGDTTAKGYIISWIIGILIGVVLGFAIIKVQRWAIIIFTSIGGAQIVSQFAANYMLVNFSVEKWVLRIGNTLFPGVHFTPETLLAGILFIMLFTAGVIVQSQGKK